MPTLTFTFACPRCRGPLEFADAQHWSCAHDGLRFSNTDGIWRFLLPERSSHFEQFIREYETVRAAEGRGSSDPAYYRSLPYLASTEKLGSAWQVRSKGFEALLEHVIGPLEKRLNRALKILDLGAGNCWLSNRLAGRGHQLAAVDLLTNELDGLGAYKYYETEFLRLLAEFDRLPLAGQQCDLVIFNASFHYAENYLSCLNEAKRVLEPLGQLLILDTPIYRDSASGQQMVAERQAQYRQKYGFPSNALNSENYLTFERLEALGRQAGFAWHAVAPAYSIGWQLRTALNGFRSRREPAKFRLLMGRSTRREQSIAP